MSIKINNFCSLSTSPSFQAWLYNLNSELYSRFTEEMRKSGGCARNAQIMQLVLNDIKNIGKYDELLEFLQREHPHVLDMKVSKIDKINNNVFPDYNIDVLTYPHRLVLKGDLNSLNKEIDLLKRFKFKVDFVIEGGFAYIEYLDKHEKGISEEIPEENWRTVIYRKNKLL